MHNSRRLVLVLVLLIGTLAGARGYPQTSQQHKPDAAIQSELDQLAELMDGTLSDRVPRWQCRAEKRNDCGPDGCDAVEPTVWVNLDFPASKYERCDQAGCDEYPMEARASGIFTIVTLPRQPGTFLKSLNNGSESVEVTSSGTGVLVAHGRCVPR